MASPIVGRSLEAVQLDEVLSGAAGGTAGIAFIEGEPGIGKSTLLEHATARARDLGFAIFAARAEELERDRPFRVIASAFGCTSRGGDDRRSAIAHLLRSPPSRDGIAHMLIDAFEDLAEAEALTRATLLIIDDLQWADPGTLRALAAICRGMAAYPLAVIAAMRHAPRSEELTTLLRATSADAVRLHLDALDTSAVRQLARAQLGTEPGPRLRAHLDGAAGNPFYILELLRALTGASAIRGDGSSAEIDGVALPPSLVLLLLNRLSGLPAADLDLVRTAAVLGTSFRIADLATAAEVDETRAVAAVLSLREQDVFTDDGEKVRFRHDLIREAVYHDLGEPIRLAMHRRIGLALSATGVASLESVEHLMRGARPGDTDMADRMLDAAQVFGALDARTRAALIERALEVSPDHPQRELFRRELAWQMMRLADPDAAIALLRRILPDTATVDDRLDIMWSLMRFYQLVGDDRSARSWAADVVALLAPIENRDELMAGFMLGWTAEVLGDVDAALRYSERAAELADGSYLEAELHDRCSHLLSATARSGDALVHSQRALALGERSYSPVTFLRHQAWALGDLDRCHEAEASIAIGRASGERLGLPMATARLMMESAHLRYLLGRWDDAVIEAETAMRTSFESRIVYLGPDPVSILAWIAYHRDDEAGAEWCRASRREDRAPPPLLHRALDIVEAFDLGDQTAARDGAGALLRTVVAGPTERRYFDMLPLLTRIALATGDRTTARMGCDAAVRIAANSDAPSVALGAARCVALMDGDPSAARRAVELAGVSPRALLAAQAFEDVAAALPPDESLSALAEAARLFAGMGAVRDHSRVAARLPGTARAQPVRTRKGSGWEALTPAELDVVRFAADGLTNREIGAALFISPRTVSTHLSHVFDKLGLRSRIELAREVARRSAMGASS